jgi:hypothetical protein
MSTSIRHCFLSQIAIVSDTKVHFLIKLADSSLFNPQSFLLEIQGVLNPHRAQVAADLWFDRAGQSGRPSSPPGPSGRWGWWGITGADAADRRAEEGARGEAHGAHLQRRP